MEAVADVIAQPFDPKASFLIAGDTTSLLIRLRRVTSFATLSVTWPSSDSSSTIAREKVRF